MTSDVPSAIADWIEADQHERPFFRDRDFVSAFGRPGPAHLRAAVGELKRRAEAKAQAAGMPISWQSRLLDDGGAHLPTSVNATVHPPKKV